MRRRKTDAPTKDIKQTKAVEDKAPEPLTVVFTPPEDRRSTDIPPELIADLKHDGFVLEWHHKSIVDQRNGARIDVDSLITGRSASRAKNNWLPVRCNDFADEGSDIGPLAEFAEEKSGPVDRLVTQGNGGLVLEYNRIEMYRAALEYEQGKVDHLLAKAGGFVKGFHPTPIVGSQTESALRYNFIRKGYEPLLIPADTGK